jgi:excinuclease UvrABC helicase subunit UvrB
MDMKFVAEIEAHLTETKAELGLCVDDLDLPERGVFSVRDDGIDVTAMEIERHRRDIPMLRDDIESLESALAYARRSS